MAKDRLIDYSATNASNTDVGGVGIQGTNKVSNFDNAVREMMTHLAETVAGTYPVYDTWKWCDPVDITKTFRFDGGNNTTGTDRVYTVPDANGTLQLQDGRFYGQIYGLTLSNSVGDAINDIDIATGYCYDSTGAVLMSLSSLLTKRLDAAWAVGSNQGGLDTGTIANTTYHIYIIRRPDTGVVDAIFSTSASSPTLPTSYTQYRRIGSIIRSGATILAFIQDGDYFTLSTPVTDISATNPGTAAVTRTLTVPVGIRVRVRGIVNLGTTTAAGTNYSAYLSDLSTTDTASSVVGAHQVVMTSQAAATRASSTFEVYSNTSAQIRSRMETSDANTTLRITTMGWVDTRGR